MRKAQDIVTRQVAGHTFLMPQRAGQAGLWLYDLNDTAAFVWTKLDELFDENALLAAVREEFEADEADVARDVRELLRDLREVGAIE